jgi:hypothetical protein
MASIILATDFYEQAQHIRGPQTNFTFPLWPLNNLLGVLKNILELKHGTIGIKSLASEPIGSDEDRKEI